MKHIKISWHSEQKKFTETGEIVSSGGVIVYPTDTIYGFGCNPDNIEAVRKIYEIKGREEASPLLLLIDKPERLDHWCDDIPEAAVEMTSHWPAPLTLILPVKTTVTRELTRGKNSLGFRVPDDPMIRDLVSAFGGCITSTSVNRSGNPPLHDPGKIISSFGDEIDLFLDAGILPPSSPSTIFLCTGEKPTLLRQGAWKM